MTPEEKRKIYRRADLLKKLENAEKDLQSIKNSCFLSPPYAVELKYCDTKLATFKLTPVLKELLIDQYLIEIASLTKELTDESL